MGRFMLTQIWESTPIMATIPIKMATWLKMLFTKKLMNAAITSHTSLFRMTTGS